MKKSLTSIRHLPARFAVLAALIVLSLWVLAPSVAQAASTHTTKCDANDLQCVIAFGNQRIEERQEALTTLKNKTIEQHQDHHISDSESDAIQQNVNEKQEGLSTLKVKLDAEINARAAREDVKDIYTQFRIFAVVLPRDYRRLHLDIEVTLLDTLKDLQPKLEQKVDTAPSDKKARLTDPFNDFKMALANAEGQVDAAMAILPSITVDEFNADPAGYRAKFSNFKADINNAHVDLQKAARDFHQITEILGK